MRIYRRLTLALLAVAALTSCVTESASERPELRAGMSRDDLRAWYGRPVRVEPAAGGGENWYYLFVSWSRPQVEATTARDTLDPDVSSVGLSVSSSRGEQECPVHLSAEGFVTAPVPEGRIVHK